MSVFPRLFHLFRPFFQVLLHTRGKLSDVYNVYKGLIVLRKANPEAFGANEAVNIDTAGYSKVVDVTSETVIFFVHLFGFSSFNTKCSVLKIL